MSLSRTGWCLGPLLLATASGCFSFYSYRPVSVLVRDAETGKPIPDAGVNIWYPLGSGTAPPVESSAMSDSAGIAHLQAAPHGDAGVMVTAKAPGYLFVEHAVSSEAIARIEPDHWFMKAEPRPASIVVDMYAEPRPAVEMLVPNGFRGILHLRLHLRDDVVWTTGQRVFPCTVGSSGIAEVELASSLRRFYPLGIRAKFADGTILSREAAPQELGLRWLKSEPGEETFVVGTKSEYDEINTALRPKRGEPRSDDNSRDQGHGHRHRGGDQGELRPFQ
jgi:hypothetical protein